MLLWSRDLARATTRHPSRNPPSATSDGDHTPLITSAEPSPMPPSVGIPTQLTFLAVHMEPSFVKLSRPRPQNTAAAFVLHVLQSFNTQTVCGVPPVMTPPSLSDASETLPASRPIHKLHRNVVGSPMCFPPRGCATHPPQLLANIFGLPRPLMKRPPR